MTSQEWADAADRGDPRALGQALAAALQQASAELEIQAIPDWDDLPPLHQQQVTRAGELLREQGWIAT